ncbi:MAG: nucleotidyltransferase family protein [Rhodothermales bacterium]|nr:nucleotidyltransferase family protein [Rhodothermales bacterium]
MIKTHAIHENGHDSTVKTAREGPIVSGASREMEFILTVLHANWPEAGPARAGTLIEIGLDWRLVLRLAIHHGVIDLFFDNLRGTIVDLLPQSLTDSLQANSQLSAHKNLYFSSELIHIVSLLERGGIPVISLKGPLLGSYLYDNISLRPFGDLDLVVRKEDILRAKTILVEEGFRPISMLSADDEKDYIESQFALTLTRKRGDFQTVAELHWALTHRFFSFKFDPENVWTMTEHLKLSDTTITTLARPLLLLFLCVHGAKHDWNRIIWLCDVVRLAQRMTDEDWKTFEHLANQTRSVRMATVGLGLGQQLMGYTYPEGILTLINSDARGQKWTTRLAQHFKSGETNKLPKLVSMRFQTGVRESVRDRWGSYWQQFKLLISPTESDRSFIKLPRLLYPLYYVVRPLRVILQRTR